MSVAPRPEVAPAMVRISCESLKSVDEILSRKEGEEQPDAIATLSVRDPVSFWDGRQESKFATILDKLAARRVNLPSGVVRLRNLALARNGKKSVNNKDLDEQQQQQQQQSGQMVSRPSPLALRHLQVSSCQIDPQGLESIIRYVHGNAILATLSLKVNSIYPATSDAMIKLAGAVSMSNLRTLELANNPIGVRSIVQLLDNLDSPSLTHLTLSLTMQREKLAEDQKNNPLWTSDTDPVWREEGLERTWKKELSKVADGLVRLISNSGKGGGGYAPRLEKLALNGNDFDWKTVKKIVAAVLQGNQNLTQLELFGAMKDNDSNSESDREQLPAAQTEGTVRRVSSIGSLYLQLRRNSRSTNGEGNATPPRTRISQHDFFGDASEPLSKQNWRFLLGRHLWKNRLMRMAVKDASRHMLPIVRTLSCRCREGEESAGPAKGPYFAFTKLPPEIRRRIVFYLDDKRVLSEGQIERILTFASNPATIGMGSTSAHLGLNTLALRDIDQEKGELDSDGYSTKATEREYGWLPHHPWSWTEVLQTRPMCRDWPATVLDETMSRSTAGDDDDNRDIQGLGGGGPDGRGGITYGHKAGPDSARRKWLEEQSALHAFWETTGTYREET